MTKRMNQIGSLLAAGALAAPACGDAPAAPGRQPIDRVAQAVRGDQPFDVDFAGCREVANVGLLPTANARPLVPSSFTLVGEDAAQTPFVVRTVHCDSISVDGNDDKPGDILQIGALITAPDGDGDINNYTLFFDTSHERLAARLKKAGVAARLVPQLQESFTPDADGSGAYHFAVPAPFDPELSFDGRVGAPVALLPFLANWWATDGVTVKMSSTFPELSASFDDSVALTVPAGTPLASLLGATSVSAWPVLTLFDHFASAHMHVTVR